MSVHYKYALPGLPFNFLGTLSETQRDNFISWVNNQSANIPGIQLAHQIRAQQLRKTAGLLEKYYSTSYPDQLSPTFIKASWKPDAPNHFPFGYSIDQAPAVTVQQIKDKFQSRLSAIDDAVFHMNFVRTMIEKQEDLAQYSFEATINLPKLTSKLHYMFGQPEYESTLVKDKTQSYKGSPLYRVHQLDSPTPWEIDSKTGGTVQINGVMSS